MLFHYMDLARRKPNLLNENYIFIISVESSFLVFHSKNSYSSRRCLFFYYPLRIFNRRCQERHHNSTLIEFLIKSKPGICDISKFIYLNRNDYLGRRLEPNQLDSTLLYRFTFAAYSAELHYSHQIYAGQVRSAMSHKRYGDRIKTFARKRCAPLTIPYILSKYDPAMPPS